MCDTCGCGEPEGYTVKHSHGPGSGHFHSHEGHDHDHPHDHGHEHGLSHERVITVERDILSENNRMAARNRGFFEGRGVFAVNLVSSPGSGKTTLLENTIAALSGTHRIFVIEGDQQTSRDAERIEQAGAPAVQVNTGTGCHLDARMVASALDHLDLPPGSLLFIENVGNLVCPALFDLGEQLRVVIISVTEGEDKPLKYPYMFASSALCILNKSDLLPYVDVDVNKVKEYALSINPKIEFQVMSAKTGEGMEPWLERLRRISE